MGSDQPLSNRREAEDAVRTAYQRVEGLDEAKEIFAQVCFEAHTYLSDGEISRVIGGGLGRKRIWQLRKKVEETNGGSGD